jgi:hypothetical protein
MIRLLLADCNEESHFLYRRFLRVRVDLLYDVFAVECLVHGKDKYADSEIEFRTAIASRC